MSDPVEKGKFSAEIGQEVIDAALESVERRTHPTPQAPPAGEEPVPVEVAAPEEERAKELESLKAQLELSQAKGRELMEKLKEEHDRLLRTVADLENYKRRAGKEKEEIQKFGVERLLKDFLPVLDNLDRALEHARGSKDLAGLAEGVGMTRKLFEDTLARHGVRPFSAVGKPFDPAYHEAMQQVESAEVPPGQVLSEVVRGFLLHERLVRPALVTVAVAKSQPEKNEG